MAIEMNPITGELYDSGTGSSVENEEELSYGIYPMPDTRGDENGIGDGDPFWAQIGINPSTLSDFSSSPSNQQILKDIGYTGSFDAASVGKFIKSVAGDPAKLAVIGAGLMAASRPSQSTGPTGFQGKIPKYTATRNMLTAPPVGRRPGSGGIDYGGGTSYFDKAGNLVSSNERTLEELRQAAINNPFNRAATYEGQTGLGQTDLATLLADLNKAPGQVTPPPSASTPPSTGGYVQPPPTKDTSGFVTGAGDTGARFDPFKPSLPPGTTMAMDPTTRVGNTVTTDGVTRPYDPLRGTMFTNAEMQARADKELADRQAGRAALAAANPNQDFVITEGNGQPRPDTTPTGFVAPIYNAAVLPPKDQPYVNPYASSLANPATIPLMSGETQEQGAARLQAQSDALEARRTARAGLAAANPGKEFVIAQGFAEGGLASNGFVVPADVVSHFGNGSSEAGLKLLASKLGAKPIKGDGDGMSDSIPTSIDGKQEARVANDEAFISPAMVKRLGGGDEEKGAKKLYAMMDKIRKARTGSEEQGKQINPDKFMPGGSVKNYATGGTTLPSTATGSESSLSNWSGEYVTDMLGRGSALAQAPYQAYTGPLTAGASQLQQQAFAGAGGLQTPGSIGQAAGTAGGIANLAANMRYTPQTTDFFGNANVSGLGVAPSYGMGMPQPSGDTTFSTRPYRVKGAAPVQQDSISPGYTDPMAPSVGGAELMPMGDQINYAGGTPDFDETTGTYTKPALMPSGGGDGGMIQNRMMYRGPAEQPMQGAGLPGLMQPQQPQQPQASQPVGNVAQQYMNPYLESALRPQMAEMQRAADIARLSDAARLTQAGAYGGSRQAIMESEGRRNLLGKQTEALGQGYSTAYDKAMQQFNADQARRAQEAQFGATFGLQGAQTGIQGAQAQGQLGALQSQSDINNLKAMMEAGGVQRGIESEGIAADKAQFEEARLNPYKMIQFEQSLLSGLPLAAQSYTMPGQSNLQQFAGGATTLTQLLKNLGYKLD